MDCLPKFSEVRFERYSYVFIVAIWFRSFIGSLPDSQGCMWQAWYKVTPVDSSLLRFHRLDISVLLICTYLLDCLRPPLPCGRLMRCNYSGSRILGRQCLDKHLPLHFVSAFVVCRTTCCLSDCFQRIAWPQWLAVFKINATGIITFLDWPLLNDFSISNSLRTFGMAADCCEP